jgi:sporulation integral membrane protein YlbJ
LRKRLGGFNLAKVKKALRYATLPAIVAFINIFLVVFPRETIAAAREGIVLWGVSVAPALFTFMTGVNMLSGLGVLEFIGALAEPAARRLFGVSGKGLSAFVFGIAGGYPMGAKIVGEMRAAGQIDREEALRLLKFANNSGPMFIVGAAGVGMFNSTQTGYLILAGHLTAALILGLIFRRSKNVGAPARKAPALRKVPAGRLLAVAVGGAVESVLKVGGFIVIFRVVTEVLSKCGVFAAAARLLSGFLDAGIAEGIAVGAIEMTNGVARLSAVNGRLSSCAAAAVISWGGLSVHAQSIGFLADSDVPTAPYIAAKAAHGALACLVCLLLHPLFERPMAVPTFAGGGALMSAAGGLQFFGIGAAVLILFGLIGMLSKRLAG